MDLVQALGVTPDAGEPMAAADIARIIQQVSSGDGPIPVTGATGRSHALPFYDTARLHVMTSPDWAPAGTHLCFVEHEGTVTWLEGASPPLHDLNAQVPIRLTPDNILNYLRFFCFFVRGSDGPFLVLETPDSVLAPEANRRIWSADNFAPAEYRGRRGNGNFLTAAIIHYGNSLFAASFEIQPGGFIEMQDDAPLHADLPAGVDLPITLVRDSAPLDDEIPF